MNNVLFEFYIGDTYTRDFTITGYSSEITNVYFTVKSNNTDKRYVLQKKLNDGITLTDDSGEGEERIRTYNILINAGETENMKPDKDYSFDIEIVSPNNIKKTIITGTFRLINTSTRQYNEGV
jgi:hypothetical protein